MEPHKSFIIFAVIVLCFQVEEKGSADNQDGTRSEGDSNVHNKEPRTGNDHNALSPQDHLSKLDNQNTDHTVFSGSQNLKDTTWPCQTSHDIADIDIKKQNTSSSIIPHKPQNSETDNDTSLTFKNNNNNNNNANDAQFAKHKRSHINGNDLSLNQDRQAGKNVTALSGYKEIAEDTKRYGTVLAANKEASDQTDKRSSGKESVVFSGDRHEGGRNWADKSSSTRDGYSWRVGRRRSPHSPRPKLWGSKTEWSSSGQGDTTRSWDELLMAALLGWGISGSEVIRLKRIRRQSPDGNQLVVREPVRAASCRCKACLKDGSAYLDYDRENAAFNKPVKISSTSKGEGKNDSVGGCGALNGINSTVFSPRSVSVPNCFHTQPYDKAAWFNVDLLYKYSFKDMVLFRNSGKTGANWISAVDVLVDGRLCFRYSSTKQGTDNTVSTRSKIPCNAVMTGQFVRFQKRRKEIKDFNRILGFCELQIWVCTMGTFAESGQQCKPCPKSCSYTCDNYFGCDKKTLHDVAVAKKVVVSDLLWGSGNYIVDTFATAGKNPQCVKTKDSFSLPILHWVRIELGITYLIYNVRLHARVDCCSVNELRNFYVVVTDEISKSLELPPARKYLCVYGGALPTGVISDVGCFKPLPGKYVTLIKNDTHGLSICEMQVFGHWRYKLKVGSKCTAQSEVAVCNNGSVCQDGRCKAKATYECTNTEDCLQPAVCDEGRCRYTLNHKCPSQEYCKSGLICEGIPTKCKRGFKNKDKCSEGECITKALCDPLDRCRLRVGQECGDSTECIAGAQCKKWCQCTTGISSQEGDLCLPISGLPGSACDSDGRCKTQTCLDGACACPPGKIIFPRNFSCRKKGGSTCTNDTDCGLDTKCENGKCLLQPGANCSGIADLCTASTKCESDICKVKAGEYCAEYKDQCALGSTCSDGKCKILLGESCEDARGSCLEGTCSELDELTCKFDAGQNCTIQKYQQQTHCRTGTVCEDGLVCKIKAGHECTDDKFCRSGTMCAERQEIAAKKCRLPMGGNCMTTDECIEPTVCDAQGICLLGKDADCKGRPGLCAVGATCSKGQCQCLQGLTYHQSNCAPKLGHLFTVCNISLSVEERCKDDMAVCLEDQHTAKCVCRGSLAVDRSNLKCGTDAGFACSNGSSDSVPCIFGAVCFDGVCLLKAGELCSGEKKGHCVPGSVCDVDGICRLSIHQNCIGHELDCKIGLFCDSLKRCRVGPGEDCQNDRECMAGSTCSNGKCQCTEGITSHKNGICVPDEGQVGGKCKDKTCLDDLAECDQDTGLCQCQSGFSANPGDFTCAKSPGAECAEDSECTTELICDPTYLTCRIPVGHLCDGENKDYCMNGTVCDFDSVCKLNLRGDCSGENYAFCRSGTFCDLLEQCHHGVGDRCDNDETEGHWCVAGAECDDNVCRCDRDVSSEYGVLCEPAAGRYGAPCGSAGGKCEVKNSECHDDYCVCESGYSPDRKFGCGGSAESKGTINVKLIGILVGVCAVCMLVVAGLVSICFKRGLHKKSARMEVLNRRRESLKDLEKLEKEVSTMLESGGEGTTTSMGATSTSMPQDTSTTANDTSTVMESSTGESTI